MALFAVQTVTVAISTQVSSPFRFDGAGIVGAYVPGNGNVFLQAAPAINTVSADFFRVVIAAGSNQWTAPASSFVMLSEVALAAPVLRWEYSASQTASRAIQMIVKAPPGIPAT